MGDDPGVMDDDPAAYGAAWAAEYDGLFEDRDDPFRVSARLKELTPGRQIGRAHV